MLVIRIRIDAMIAIWKIIILLIMIGSQIYLYTLQIIN